MERGKWLFRKMDRPIREADEVITCFRDGIVTLRKNRRVRGFTESLKEIGYQGIRRGDLVIHGMDAFAGAIGVADSDGKGTPVYSVCEPGPTANAQYYAYALREMARSQWIQSLTKGIRERSTDFRFGGFGSQLLPLPPLPEQAAIVRFPRPCRQEYSALHPCQTEADQAVGGAEAGHHPPGCYRPDRRPNRPALSGLQALRRGVARGRSGALGKESGVAVVSNRARQGHEPRVHR